MTWRGLWIGADDGRFDVFDTPKDPKGKDEDDDDDDEEVTPEEPPMDEDLLIKRDHPPDPKDPQDPRISIISNPRSKKRLW